MTSKRFWPRLRAWTAARARSYGRVVVALLLNVPFLVAALSRYPDGLNWASLGGVYAVLVFFGYYVSILLFCLTCLFLALGALRRLFLAASATVLALALYFLVVDGIVYRALRTHIDAFWLRYVTTTFGGLGIGVKELTAAGALLILIAALEWWLFRLAERVPARRALTGALIAVCGAAFVVTQAMHIAAYERNDTRITALTPNLPFYYPVTSYRNAIKHGGRFVMIREAYGGTDSRNGRQSLRYPLHEVPCAVPAVRARPNMLVLLLESWRADVMDSVTMPQTYAFSKRASLFTNHFSSGNSTPAGVFPVFYGIHSTYWAAVKANNPSIHNPVLIDALTANGYDFGIFANSHFDRHKIKDAVFRDIDVHESFAGATADAHDRDMTDRLFEFMESRHQSGQPFFGFAFYKSTHFPYGYPPDAAPFQPARELNVLLADAKDDPTPVLNDYRNSVRYVDTLIGGLIERMARAGILDSTIVVITGDHGEEFNDNRSNYWGHTGNFTAYQTRVPLIVYIPWQQPRRVNAVTSQVDVAPTLMQEGLRCGWHTDDYSNGLNLFGSLPPTRPVVVSSYVNHALVVGDDVLVIWPLYVQRHRLNDIKAAAPWPGRDVMQRALAELSHFNGSTVQGR